MGLSDRIANGADLIVKVAACATDPTGLSIVGTTGSGWLNLRAIFSAAPRVADPYPWIAQDLTARLTDPALRDFHLPASGDFHLPQMLELAEPTSADLVAADRDSAAVVAAMLRALPEERAEYASVEIREAFGHWVGPAMARLLADPGFRETQAPDIRDAVLRRLTDLKAGQDAQTDKIDEILRRLGGAGTVLADPEVLSLEELQVLAATFGEADGRGKADLVWFIQTKAQEHVAFVAEIEAIDERTAELGNLKASARAAAERMDYAEVESLLSMVSETEIGVAADTLELRAKNSLLRGRVEEAHRLLSAAADSFAVVDDLHPARYRYPYVNMLLAHGRRYDGRALPFAERMARTALELCRGEETRRDRAILHFGMGRVLGELGNQTLGSEGFGFLRQAEEMLGAALKGFQEDEDLDGFLTVGDEIVSLLIVLAARVDGEAAAPLLKQAEGLCRQCLSLIDEKGNQLGWALGHARLGAVLTRLGDISGTRGSDALVLEAVRSLRMTADILDPLSQPDAWAGAQLNLGLALRALGQSASIAKNTVRSGEATTAFRAALSVYDERAHASEWAAAQMNLGLALIDEGCISDRGDRAHVFAEAVAATRAALHVFTEPAFPSRWAAGMTNLGNALREQGACSHSDAAEELICAARQAHRDAARVFNETASPEFWATTMYNISLAEEQLADLDGCADPAAHLRAALAAVTAALGVFDRDHMEYNHEKATGLKARLEARLAARQAAP